MKNKFAEDIIVALENQGVQARTVTTTKNNGVLLVGISINNGTNISPTIYIDEMYNKGLSAEKAAEIVLEKNEESKAVSFDVDSISDFESVKGNIIFQLVAGNQKRFGNKPKDVVAVPVLKDLAKIYKINLGAVNGGEGSITITNQLLNTWMTSVEAIDSIAMQNTPKVNKISFKTMAETLAGFGMGEIIPFDAMEIPMYILTNEKMIGGASTILYPNIMNVLAEKLNDNLIVIPSSIHEAIIIPASNIESLSDIARMIVEVNQNCVSPEEILGDHPYMFYRKEQRLVAA